jgi:hypothetical protein
MKDMQKLYEMNKEPDPNESELRSYRERQVLNRKNEKRNYAKTAEKQEKDYVSLLFRRKMLMLEGILVVVVLIIAGFLVKGIFSGNSKLENYASPSLNLVEETENEEIVSQDKNTSENDSNKSKAVKKDNATKAKSKKKKIQVGDVVTFTGKTHYKSSYKNARKENCTSGKAKVTKINKSGIHPYHLKGIGSCTVFGWVDKENVK